METQHAVVCWALSFWPIRPYILIGKLNKWLCVWGFCNVFAGFMFGKNTLWAQEVRNLIFRKTATCSHLLMAASGCKWLQVAASGCKWLQVAASGCKWLQVAASGCKWLQVAASGCKGKWLRVLPLCGVRSQRLAPRPELRRVQLLQPLWLPQWLRVPCRENHRWVTWRWGWIRKMFRKLTLRWILWQWPLLALQWLVPAPMHLCFRLLAQSPLWPSKSHRLWRRWALPSLPRSLSHLASPHHRAWGRPTPTATCWTLAFLLKMVEQAARTERLWQWTVVVSLNLQLCQLCPWQSTTCESLRRRWTSTVTEIGAGHRRGSGENPFLMEPLNLQYLPWWASCLETKAGGWEDKNQHFTKWWWVMMMMMMMMMMIVIHDSWVLIYSWSMMMINDSWFMIT